MDMSVKNKGIVAGSVVSLVIVILFFFWLLCLNHVSVNHIGVAYDAMGGEITVQKTPGWYTTTPMTRVTYIQTTPITVTIPSGAKLIISKVVRFKPEGIEDYIRLQGFGYSMNSELQSVLLGYAFSGKTYSFLEIMQEATPENVNVDPLYKK